MAQVLLFHHIQGQTDGFVEFAGRLRCAGHTVYTPDLFDGRTFATIEEGAAWVDDVGFSEVVQKAVAIADTLPTSLVYAGFSLGAVPAQKLAQTRSGALGALLFEGCAPMSEFGDRWPVNVPVQVHGMDADPFFSGEGDVDAARELVDQAALTTRAELFIYPGDRHLFADGSLPSFDADATELMVTRVLAFLDDVTLTPADGLDA